MQRQHIVSFVIAALILSPVFASAEDTRISGSAAAVIPSGKARTSANAGGEVHPPLPPKPDNYSWGASDQTSMPGKGAAGQGRMPGTSTKGQPKLMMASDTRSLPSDLIRRIEDRDGRSSSSWEKAERPEPRGRMMASGTQSGVGPCRESASSSDCSRFKGELRERIGEHRGEIWRHASDMVQKRLLAALGRFSKLADRIDSRIEKLKSSGVDTSEAEARMSIARKRLGDARVAVDAVSEAVNDVATALESGSSTTPIDDVKKPAKDAMEGARRSLLAVMQALNDVMPALHMENPSKGSTEASTTLSASGTPKLPGGMLRDKERATSSSSDDRPDPSR